VFAVGVSVGVLAQVPAVGLAFAPCDGPVGSMATQYEGCGKMDGRVVAAQESDVMLFLSRIRTLKFRQAVGMAQKAWEVETALAADVAAWRKKIFARRCRVQTAADKRDFAVISDRVDSARKAYEDFKAFEACHGREAYEADQFEADEACHNDALSA
jgi:hypothetical protein